MGWPIGTSCAYSFTFSFNCAVDFLGMSADSSQVVVNSDDNTTFSVYVSGKAMEHQQKLQWFTAGGEDCTFDDASLDFATFPGYGSESANLEISSSSSWPVWVNNSMSGQANQIQVQIDDIYRKHCVPSVLVSVPCEVTSVINSWQVENETVDPWDGSATLIAYDLTSIWQNGFGMQYAVD